MKRLFLKSTHGEEDNSLSRVSLTLRALAIAALGLVLAGAGCEEMSPISPPSGDYPGTIVVTLDYPDSDAVYYTLDGSEPTSSCLVYDPNELILIETSAVIKSRGVTFGSVPVYTDVSSETYNIGGGDSSTVDESTNRLAILAWLEYETDTRQIFSDKYFGGCEPVVGCGGGLDLGQMGLYTICDIDSHIEDTAACEAAGGGWITWNVVQEGLGGGSQFTYNNYAYQLADGQILSATGQVVGHFDSDGTGYTNTSEGETIVTSGAYEASIDDSVSITTREKTGGSYYVSCTAAGCATGGNTYILSPGPVIELLPPAPASCNYGPEFIRIQQGANCLSPSDKGPFADLLACNSDLAEQQWELIEDTDSAEEDFKIQLKDGTGCLSAKPQDASPFHYYEIAACVADSNGQRFAFAKSAGVTGKEARIQSHPDTFDGYPGVMCLAGLTPTAQLITAYDCNDASKDFDFQFVIGNTFPAEELDPTTDLLAPLEPTIIDFSNRSSVNHQETVEIPSAAYANLNITVTAENNDGHTKKVSASNLEGFGVYTSGINLNGIQTNEL